MFIGRFACCKNLRILRRPQAAHIASRPVAASNSLGAYWFHETSAIPKAFAPASSNDLPASPRERWFWTA